MMIITHQSFIYLSKIFQGGVTGTVGSARLGYMKTADRPGGNKETARDCRLDTMLHNAVGHSTADVRGPAKSVRADGGAVLQCTVCMEGGRETRVVEQFFL